MPLLHSRLVFFGESVGYFYVRTEVTQLDQRRIEHRTTIKTSQVTAKAAQKSAQVAAKATAAAVKAIITATKALVAAIAAGGWIAVAVIICLIGLIVASCFGVFFSGEDTGTGQTMQTVVREINEDYEN